MSKLKGSVSLFSAMIFLMVVSVITVTIESARIQGAKVMLNVALTMGLDSLFAQYDSQLFSQFGVLLLNGNQDGKGIDEDVLTGKISEYVEYNLDMDKELYFAKNTDLYGIDLTGISVDRVIKPTGSGGLLWQDMVVDYEKYAKVVDLAAGYLGIDDASEEAVAVDEISNQMTSVAEKIMIVNQSARAIIEKIDGVICSSDGMNIERPLTTVVFLKKFCPFPVTMEDTNIPYTGIFNAVKSKFKNPMEFIDAAIVSNNGGKNCSQDMDRLVKLIELCEVPLDDALAIMDTIETNQKSIDTEIGILDNLISSNINIIEPETMEGITEEYESICEYDEILLEDICDVVKMGETLRKDKDIFSKIKSAANSINDSKTQDEINLILQDIKELIEEFSFEGLRFEYENLVIAEDNTDILGEMREFIETGFLKLVIPKDKPLSSREIKVKDLASTVVDTEMATDIQKEGNIATVGAKKLIYLEYIMDKFICFTDEKEGAALNYEVEYVLFGKKTDKDNLTSVVLSIATIRSGINMIYLISNSQKRDSAYGIAANLVGAAKYEPLIRIVQFALLYLWAYAEALMDVRSLLNGDEIALAKSDETWQLSIENLMSLNFEDSGVEQEGIDYEGFLRFLLFLEGDGKKSAYTMDLVELWMINNGKKDFRLKRYVYGIEITAAYEVAGGYYYTEKAVYTY